MHAALQKFAETFCRPLPFRFVIGIPFTVWNITDDSRKSFPFNIFRP